MPQDQHVITGNLGLPVSEPILEYRRSRTPPKKLNSLPETLRKDYTPYLVKIGANPLKIDTRVLERKFVDPLLSAELFNRVIRQHDIMKMFNLLFPRDKLPVVINKVFKSFQKESQKNLESRLAKDNSDLPKFLSDLLPGPFGHLVRDPPEEKVKVEAYTKKKTRKDTNEEKFCRFIMRVLQEVEKHFDPENPPAERRKWTGRFNSTALKSAVSDIQRQLDILITKTDVKLEDDEREGERLSWLEFDTFAELKAIENEHKSETEYKKNVEPEVNNYSYCMFESQENHRFVPSFSLVGRDARVSIYDRSGAIHSAPFDIVKHPEAFLHLIIGFTYIDDIYLGYDPTIEVDETKQRWITIKNKKYRIKKTIWRSIMISGRATTCWLVVDKDGNEFIVKDSWAQLSRRQSEVDFLEIMKLYNIDGVCQMVDYEDIKIDGQLDSTDNNRGFVDGLVNRVHRRIIFKDPAVPITKFLSLKELIRAFRDCVGVHQELCEEALILHRDISLCNMMLRRGNDEFPRQGLLIDFDYADDLNEGRKNAAEAVAKEKVREALKDTLRINEIRTKPSKAKSGRRKKKPSKLCKVQLEQQEREDYEEMIKLHGHRTGTHPFIAAQILSDKANHTPGHDLESFYYVLLYISLLYTGPNDEQQENGMIPYFMHAWLHPEKVDECSLGDMKIAHRYLDENGFNKNIIDNLNAYMKPLGPCLRKLHAALRDPAKLTHAYFIQVFEETLKELEDEPVDKVEDGYVVDDKVVPRSSKVHVHPPGAAFKHGFIATSNLDAMPANDDPEVDLISETLARQELMRKHRANVNCSTPSNAAASSSRVTLDVPSPSQINRRTSEMVPERTTYRRRFSQVESPEEQQSKRRK